MRQCFLIADDLTGACDSAVHFAMRGHPTTVSISLANNQMDSHVLAVSADSRSAYSSASEAIFGAVARMHPVESVRNVIHKIDSTLRGNPGGGIRAAMSAFHCGAAVITPALPAMGRIVENGWLRLPGDPDFASIHIAHLLESQGLEQPCSALPGTVGEVLASGARMVVADAATDQDLERIVADASRWGGRLLWAGSAGLVAAIARATPRGNQVPAAPVIESPVLFCIGSNHKVTVAQEAELTARRDVDRYVMGDRLPTDRHAILRIPRACDPLSIGELLDQAPHSALLLCGGDTASLVCSAIGAHAIELIDEIAPGVPRGMLRGGEFNGRAVATKSGGFGRPDTLIQVADFFLCPQNQLESRPSR